MKHRAIRVGAGAAVLVSALAVLVSGHRVFHTVSGSTYGQAQSEAQQPHNSQSSGQGGTPPIAADPSPSKPSGKEQDGQGPDWPTIVQAASAFVSAVATVFIFGVTSRQATLSRQQVELSRQEAAYTRRPHFRVRFARLVGVDGVSLAKGKPVSVMLDVLNNGQADAVIQASHLEVFWSDKGLPANFPYVPGTSVNHFASEMEDKRHIILAGGGTQSVEVQGYRLMDDHIRNIVFGVGGWKLYLLGWIGYRRPDDRYDRFFDFALQFKPETGRFFPVENDPDYTHDPDAK